MPELTSYTLPQLYAKLEIHLRNIDAARIVTIPSKTNEVSFFDERDRAFYILTQSRKLNAIAQAIDVKLRLSL